MTQLEYVQQTEANLLRIIADLSNYRDYTVVDHVPAYDGHGAPSGLVPIGVVSNVSLEPSLPSCRVMLTIGAIGTACLTVQQSEQLRAQLELAERDADIALALAADRR